MPYRIALFDADNTLLVFTRARGQATDRSEIGGSHNFKFIKPNLNCSKEVGCRTHGSSCVESTRKD